MTALLFLFFGADNMLSRGLPVRHIYPSDLHYGPRDCLQLACGAPRFSEGTSSLASQLWAVKRLFNGLMLPDLLVEMFVDGEIGMWKCLSRGT